MRVRWKVLRVVVAMGVMAASAGTRAESHSGRVAYLRYCANCHGPEGRGDGPDAATLAQPPRDLRAGVLQRYSVEELVDRVLRGQPLPLASDPERRAALEKQGGEILEHLRRLARAQWPQVERGWALYLGRCVECHGFYGEPPAKLPAGVRPPRDLSDRSWQRAVSDADLLLAVRHGRAGMPALVPQLREEEARALVAFVRLLSPGFRAYQAKCASCHGDDGRGVRAAPGEVTKLPQVRFDRGYFRGRPEARMREQILHMLQEKEPVMPHFGAILDRRTVQGIIEYLKQEP
ncbi:MAG: hypothetical protein KatS3mg077_0757 [Candidatus Binatia bacterium]|nr:MAG: hypothetical protein KatS3mg077_0757 [Candidatus Binatia bacterium]